MGKRETGKGYQGERSFSASACHRLADAGIRGPGRNSVSVRESCSPSILPAGGRRLAWVARENDDDGEVGGGRKGMIV